MRELMCTKCGETWNPDVAVHGARDRFVRSGATIWECPSCEELAPLPQDTTRELRKIYHTYAGDIDAAANDIDRIFALVEDLA